MGRGVDYLGGATEVAYVDVSGFGYTAPYDEETGDYDYEADEIFDQDLSQMEWDDFRDNITAELKAKYKSLYEVEEWDGETRIFLRNSLAEFGISGYGGVASISVRPVYDDYHYTEGLALNWIEKVWDNVKKTINQYGTVLNRVGGFSNGESVYERAFPVDK